MYPDDRKYSKEHEWILVEGDVATIGITDFAQDQLGDIVYVEVPEIDMEVSAEDVLGTIESVKAVSEIFAPLSGTVVAVNEALEDAPDKVNSEPHDGGWYCKMRIKDVTEVESLLDAAAYAELIADS
ncbi:MAG: glycine cleavage system protein GcvH [Acidobacteriota bacterium]|nr:glycine cleavage system protein GcvH [Acidobacteriota bacterium]MDH3784622.1 glycine cleavage system protein GcvH [Acidobacteriota bacterium]